MEPEPAVDQAAKELQEKLDPSTKAPTELDRLLEKDVKWHAPTLRERAQDLPQLLVEAKAYFEAGIAGPSLPRATAIIMAGHELGKGVIWSLRHLSVSKDNKIAMSAEAMRALFIERIPGAKLEFVETTPDRCVMRAWRPGHEWLTVKWDEDDSKTAGLTAYAHKSYPTAMKIARCSSMLARMYWPDVLGGASYTVEELDEDVAPPAPAPAADPAAPALPTRREQQAPEAPQAAEPPKTDPPAAPKAPPVSAAIKEAQSALASRWRAMKEEVNPDYKWDGEMFKEFCASITGRPMPPSAWTMDDVAKITADIDTANNPMPVGQRGQPEPETTEGQEIDA